MKRLMTVLVALVALCNNSWADRILIYKGSQTNKHNDAHSQVVHFYILFDLDTLLSNSVVYGGVGKSKTFSAGTPAAYVYAPLTAPKGSETVFANGIVDMSASFELVMETFTGRNSLLNLGGTFTGEFPVTLSSSVRNIQGGGTLASDNNFVANGSYVLVKSLTQQSNESNDNLTDATTIVTAALTKEGY